MPTDDAVNAPEPDASTEAQQDTPDAEDDGVSEEDITSHPKYKELEEKHAAARQGMDKSNLSQKELKAENARLRVLANEEEKEESEEKVDPKTEMEELKKELRWELKNSKRIELVQEEFDKIVEEGYEGEKVSNSIALELAEKQAKIDSSDTKRKRQDDMTTASVTARNDKADGFLSDDSKSIGLSAKRERELAKKHPHLTAAS